MYMDVLKHNVLQTNMKHKPNGPNVTGISTDLNCSCIKCDVLRLKYFGVSDRDI